MVRSRNRAIGVLVLIVSAIALAHVYSVDPATSDEYPTCVFHDLTGLHCPGCGSLRAIQQLLHGNLLAALRMNVLAVTLLPVMLAYIGISAIASWRGTTIPWRRPRWVPAGWRWWIVALVIGFGVLRNVPYWPFELLAPH